MYDPICGLCGRQITEEEAEAGDYVESIYGEWHDHCIEAYEHDRRNRAADFWHDHRGDR